MITVIIPITLSLRDIPFITSTICSFLLFYICLKIIQQHAKIVNLKMFVCWHNSKFCVLKTLRYELKHWKVEWHKNQTNINAYKYTIFLTL